MSRKKCLYCTLNQWAILEGLGDRPSDTNMKRIAHIQRMHEIIMSVDFAWSSKPTNIDILIFSYRACEVRIPCIMSINRINFQRLGSSFLKYSDRTG